MPNDWQFPIWIAGVPQWSALKGRSMIGRSADALCQKNAPKNCNQAMGHESGATVKADYDALERFY
jgi:hypothetical protein